MVRSYHNIGYDAIVINNNNKDNDEDHETARLVMQHVDLMEDDDDDDDDDDKDDSVMITSTMNPHRQQQRKRTFQVLVVVLMASVGMLTVMYGYHYHTYGYENNNNNKNNSLNASSGSLLPFLSKNGSGSGISGHHHDHTKHEKHEKAHSHDANDDVDDTVIPMPQGVNLGSWLSLEDYFYVGDTGAVEVATPNENTVGICLPPLHVGQVGAPAWQSETDLLASLLDSTSSVAHAIQVFHAHRTTFVTEHDLHHIRYDLGIRHVRIPLGWCFTDADPETDIHESSTDEELLEKFTCPDPFYKDEGVIWPAIPRSLLERVLKSCAKFGITASLDLHTYPGATSPGTFSGVWPRKPRFWDYDDPARPEQDFGRQLYRDFVRWIEGLDPEALDGVLGIGPMNEPAHLAGVFASIPSLDYLPPLPEDLAEAYLDELDHLKYIPDGPHLRVFMWLRDAVEVFRGSQLPKLGIQLHVNVHESVLNGALIYDDVGGGDYAGRGNLAMHKLIAAWWSKTTHAHERKDWAVLDVHHYHAWAPDCLGASDGPPSGNYSCGDVEGRNAALKRCTEWATTIYRPAVDEFCGPGAKLMSGEFSTSTHHRVRHACNDVDTLQASYLMQLKAAKKADVEMYYWSYKMPFGGAFRSAWSFSELMYLLGVTNRPDVATFNCGGHIPREGEVTDDFFSG